MIAGAQTQRLRQRWQRLQCVAGSECVGRSIAHGTNMRRLCCTRRRPPAQKSCSLRCACPAPAELRIRSDKRLIRCSPNSGLQLAACRDAPASDRLLNPFRPSPPCDFRSSFLRHNLQRTEPPRTQRPASASWWHLLLGKYPSRRRHLHGWSEVHTPKGPNSDIFLSNLSSSIEEIVPL